LQGQRREIGLQHLRLAKSRQLRMLVFRPEPIAATRLQAPGPTGSLGCRGTRDTPGFQARHAAGRIEARYPRKPRIDHHAHTFDGQAGLGDVGRQHDLAPAGRGRLDGGTLIVELQFAMQRAEQDVLPLGQPLAQGLVNAPDLSLPREEHQQAAGLLVERLQHRLHHPGLDAFACPPRRAPAHRHRVHAPFAAHQRRVGK